MLKCIKFFIYRRSTSELYQCWNPHVTVALISSAVWMNWRTVCLFPSPSWSIPQSWVSLSASWGRLRSALSLCVGCSCKSRCGRPGHPVGPGAANKAEAVCTAWLIISWMIYRGYTGDGRAWKVTGEAMRQRVKNERDEEVMWGDSVQEREKQQGEGEIQS